MPAYTRPVGVPPPGDLAGIHVLVVEDDDDAREILGSLLAYAGAFVSTARTAEAALTIMGHVRADVVVCDVNLTDHDALWLLGEVRLQQPDPPPIIVVSAQDYDDHDMRRAGFVTYLRKPISHEALLNEILRAIRR